MLNHAFDHLARAWVVREWVVRVWVAREWVGERVGR